VNGKAKLIVFGDNISTRSVLGKIQGEKKSHFGLGGGGAALVDCW